MYYPPKFGESKYHCPQEGCGVYAKQFRSHLIVSRSNKNNHRHSDLFQLDHFLDIIDSNFVISKCDHCGELSIRISKTLIYPTAQVIESPNEDLTDEIKGLYNEARDVFPYSARAAAALLRLGIQLLCVELGEDGKNINKDIGELVKKGLDSNIQKMLDIIRITGNSAVHPGIIEVSEDTERVKVLFKMINLISERLITNPKITDEYYNNLPQHLIDGIQQRDHS